MLLPISMEIVKLIFSWKAKIRVIKPTMNTGLNTAKILITESSV
jgi:hypothetical protein